MLFVPIVQNLCVDSPAQPSFLKTVSTTTSGEHVLGRGSYGRVFKASYKGQPVAVKVIQPCRNGTNSSVRHEANILGWQHQNIIKIIKIKILEECAIIIMERLPGQCLQNFIDNIVISVFHRLCIMSDIACGLSYCHKNKLLHMDVKPQNMLITLLEPTSIERVPYVCKICDFGCSVRLTSDTSSDARPKGTVRYMSPNALQGKPPSVADDVYSIGITMWQLESGQQPYSSISCNETVAYNVVKIGIRPDTCSGIGRNVPYSCLTANETSSQKQCDHCELAKFKNCNVILTNIHHNPRLQHLSNSVNRNVKTPDLRSIKLDQTTFLSADRLNRTKSASMKLNFDKLLQPTKRLEPKGVVMHELKGIFSKIMCVGEKSIRNDYKSIYVSCWQESAGSRPSAAEIHLKLEALLMPLNNFK